MLQFQLYVVILPYVIPSKNLSTHTKDNFMLQFQLYVTVLSLALSSEDLSTHTRDNFILYTVISVICYSFIIYFTKCEFIYAYLNIILCCNFSCSL